MNKTELVQAIAEKANLNKTQAKAALDAGIDAIERALKGGDKVALIGFGTFQVVKKDAREGINPATKAKIKIPAKKVVKFKAGAELAAKVNTKK
ncbi:MAG: HU family DNA-binding protein [Muribaculaceae bacterium]|nr:HU family DNA-binding protein [Muribaculaceae bacterium]